MNDSKPSSKIKHWGKKHQNELQNMWGCTCMKKTTLNYIIKNTAHSEMALITRNTDH